MVCLNVIEHVPDDVGALRNIWILLETEDVPSCWFPMARSFLGHSTKYWGIAVATPWNNSPLSQDRLGFSIDGIIKFNRPGSPAWWLNGQILRRRTFGLAQIRMLNFLTPIFRKIDRLLPFPPLSLIAVLRKDGEMPALEPESN